MVHNFLVMPYQQQLISLRHKHYIIVESYYPCYITIQWFTIFSPLLTLDRISTLTTLIIGQQTTIED